MVGRRRARILGSLLVALSLAACSGGLGRTDSGAKDGFVMTVASYGESSSAGRPKYVGIFRNVGAFAKRATFTVTLRQVDGEGRPWSGQGAAEDIAEGETFQVEMESDSAPPLNRINDVVFTADRG